MQLHQYIATGKDGAHHTSCLFFGGIDMGLSNIDDLLSWAKHRVHRLRFIDGVQSLLFDFTTSIRLGAYCLLAPHKEHIARRTILLDISSKQPVSPRSGHQPMDTLLDLIRHLLQES